jgi:hypothetical protein
MEDRGSVSRVCHERDGYGGGAALAVEVMVTGW